MKGNSSLCVCACVLPLRAFGCFSPKSKEMSKSKRRRVHREGLMLQNRRLIQTTFKLQRATSGARSLLGKQLHQKRSVVFAKQHSMQIYHNSESLSGTTGNFWEIESFPWGPQSEILTIPALQESTSFLYGISIVSCSNFQKSEFPYFDTHKYVYIHTI